MPLAYAPQVLMVNNMPSGPAGLHEKWQNAGPFYGYGDSNALDYLAQRGLKLPTTRGWENGTFYIPASRKLTEEEESALDYLVMEWDYAVERVDG